MVENRKENHYVEFINVHLDVECGDRSRFNDIPQCCSLIQCVSGPTHILGHTGCFNISLQL